MPVSLVDKDLTVYCKVLGLNPVFITYPVQKYDE